VITSAVMHSLGYLKETTPAHLASVQELPQRAGWLFDSLRALFNGNLGPKRPGALHAPLGLASDVVMCAALLVLVALGLAAVVALARARSRLASRPASLSPPARSVHVAYWFTSAVLICGAYLLTAETAGGSVLHEAYCGTVIFSVAAVVPLALSGGKLARWLVPAGASVYFAASLVGLSGNYLNIAGWIATYAPKITQIAQAAHVTSGYGGYGEASSLTWNTHGRVTVRPVMECETTQGPGMCDFYLVAPSAWYVPRRRNTFLLVDSQEPWLSSLPAGLGKPIKAYAFGEMRMYLYPYDIASKLGPAPG